MISIDENCIDLTGDAPLEWAKFAFSDHHAHHAHDACDAAFCGRAQ